MLKACTGQKVRSLLSETKTEQPDFDKDNRRKGTCALIFGYELWKKVERPGAALLVVTSLGSMLKACTPPHLSRGMGDQDGCLRSEVLQGTFPNGLARRQAKSGEDQKEVTGGGPAKGFGLRQSCIPDEILENPAIRNRCTQTKEAAWLLAEDKKAKKFAELNLEEL